LEVSPSKRQVNISLSNQSSLSGFILVLFWYYCGVVMVISLFICHFYLIISVLHTILYLEYYNLAWCDVHEVNSLAHVEDSYTYIFFMTCITPSCQAFPSSTYFYALLLGVGAFHGMP
jgi:hypothetical protein